MIDIDKVAEAIWRAQYQHTPNAEFEPAVFTRDTYRRMARAAVDSLGLKHMWAMEMSNEGLSEPAFVECDDEDHARRTVANMDKSASRAAVVRRLVSPWLELTQ